jgi:hypothetical protein
MKMPSKRLSELLFLLVLASSGILAIVLIILSITQLGDLDPTR